MTPSPDAITTPLPYRTLRELVQEALTEDILRNRFRPGQRLLEEELATAYGVSRAPVREAVRALEAQGLVRHTSNKGVVVSRLTPDEIGEIYEIRAELESLATRLAVPKLDTGGLSRARALLHEMDGALDEPKRWLSLHDQFHMALYEGAGRARLCRLIADLSTAIEPHIRLFMNHPDKFRATHGAHHAILDAAERGQVEECAALVRDHMMEASEQIVALARQAES